MLPGAAGGGSSRGCGLRGGALIAVTALVGALYVARDVLLAEQPLSLPDGRTLAPGSPAYKAALAAAAAGCPSHAAAPSPQVRVVERVVTKEKVVEVDKPCPPPPAPSTCPALPSPAAPCPVCPSATTAPSEKVCPAAPSCAACPAPSTCPPPPQQAAAVTVPAGGSGAAGGLPFGVASPFAQGDDTKYLILQSPDYGRYSNNKMTFSEAAGVAAVTGRTLIAPQYKTCEGGQGPSRLYNLGAMAAGSAAHAGVRVIEDSGLDLPTLCGDSTLYVWYNSITRDLVPNPGYVKTLDWRGVTWPVAQVIDLPVDEARVPPGVAAFVREDIESLAGEEPYKSHFPAHYVRRDLKSFLTDHYFPYRMAALSQRCVVIQTLYLNLNWALVPGAFQRVAANTWPAPTLDAHVAGWFHKNRVPQHAAVGVHLRLTDLASGLDFGFARNCERGPGFVVDALKALVASLPGAADQPLLVASDNFGSPCAAGVLAAFPRHVKVESGGALRGCEETAFIQEVLSRTAGFVGNSLSSFSVAIHWARTARYGKPTNTSVFPEGP